MKKTFFILCLMCLCLFGVAQSNLSYPQYNQSSKKDVSVFFHADVFSDSIVHLVWENTETEEIKEVVVESSLNGNDFKFLSKAVVASLTDIHTNNYPGWIEYNKNILISSEHGNYRFIYNDIIPNQNTKPPVWYRVKMISAKGNVYISQVVSSAGETIFSNSDFENEDENTGNNQKGGGGGGKPGCPAVGSPPAGYVLATPHQTKNLTGTCCIWTEKLYQSQGAVQSQCGGSSYAWCCNNVPGASGCASKFVDDPCCVHQCGQYNSCSCHPWSCCPSNLVQAWVVTSVTNGSQITITPTIKDETCAGMKDGSISIVINGATAPTTITWSPNGSGTSLTGLAAGTWTVNVTDALGCVASGTYTVAAGLGVTPDAGADDTTCIGVSVTLTASGGGTYNWSNGLGTYDTVTVSPNVTTTYTVTVTGGNGCSAADDVTVTIISMTSDFTVTSPVCVNQSTSTVTYTGNGSSNATYNWNFGGGTVVSGNGQGPYEISWNTPGTYTISLDVTEFNCTSPVTTQNVVVGQVTATLAIADSVSCFGVCDGEVTVTAVGLAPYQYLWSDWQTTQTAVNLCANTVYGVTVTDANGCTTTLSITLTQPPPLTKTFSTTNVLCFGGNTGTAAGQISGGTGTYNYSWIPAVAGNVTTVNTLLAGTYTFSVTDYHGCAIDTTFTITEPPLLTASIVPTHVLCYGNSTGAADLTVAGGTPVYTYDWGNGITTEDRANIPAGNYTVTVTDANSCTVTATITITQPAAPLAISFIPTDILCYGNSTGAIDITVTGGTAAYSYDWGGGITTEDRSNIPAGTYTVVVTDFNGCTITQTVTLTEPPLLTMNFATTNVLCFGGNTGTATGQISGGTLQYTYNWIPAVALNVPSVNTLFAGVYTFSVTDSHGCTIDTTFTITEPPLLTFTYITDSANCNTYKDGSICVTPAGGTTTSPYTYSWFPTPGNGNCLNNIGAGSYTVTVKDVNGCDTSQTITIYEPLPLVLSTSGNDTICIGQNTTITASGTGGSGSYIFTWDNGLPTGSTHNVNPVITTVYSVTLADHYGCPANNESLTVTVYLPISVTATPKPHTLCFGGSTDITAVPSGGNGNYTFTWGPNIGVAGATITVTPADTTIYSVTVTDNCGSPQGVDTALVIVFPLPVVMFSADPLYGCEPLGVNFTDNSTPAIGSWLWNFGDPNSGSGTSTLQNPGHLFNQAGTYTVSLAVSTTNGCKGGYTYPDMITVYPNPEAIFTVNPSSGNTHNPTIFFSDHSILAQYWNWNFGEPASGSENFSSEINPTHNYQDSGTYTVVLLVETEHGCIDTTKRDIFIKQEIAIYFPNAFTPNDDGTNEGWRPQGVGIDEKHYSLFIYDRWGVMVFKTFDFYESWNGRMMKTEKLVPQGVYVWLVQTKDINGEKYSFKGKVTVIH